MENRDLIASKITLQRIAEVQKLAAECQAPQFKQCVEGRRNE